MDNSRGGCPGGPAAPSHSRPSPGDPWAVQGRAGDWRGVRAAAQPRAAVLPLLSKHRPGEASPMWEGKRRIRVRIYVDQNTGDGCRGFTGLWVGAEGGSAGCLPERWVRSLNV